MGIIKQAGDLVYTFRFLALLVTPFEKTKAFEAGIIDENGNKRKDFSTSTVDAREALSDYYTPFHRLVFNIKKVIAKVPGGSTRLASYAAALYLIKEQYSVSEKRILKGLEELGVDPTDLMVESSQWFVLEDKRLSPGTYKLKYEKVLNNQSFPVNANEKISVNEDAYPVGDIFGIDIYEATHSRTKQKLYITSSEIIR
jgi:hypothetical protein